MSVGGRKKRVSQYEGASDDESVLEFQNLESQLFKDKGARAQIDAQDVQPSVQK